MAATQTRERQAPVESGQVTERAFNAAVAGSLGFELAFVIAVIGALILYTDPGSFIESLTSPATVFSIKLTLVTVTISSVAAMILAVPAAYGLSHWKVPAPLLVDTLLDLPIVLPPVAAGISLLVLFGYYLGEPMEMHLGLHLPHTQAGIVVAQFFCTMTFTVRSAKAALDSVNPRLPDVARTLGSNRWRAFRRVTLPLARNGLIAGGVLTWARCMGLFGPVVMFCGATRFRTTILPTQIFLANSVGRLEEAVAATLILLVIAVVTLVVFKKLGGRGYMW